MRLAREGYPAQLPIGPDGAVAQSTHGFFPGYSMLLRAVGEVTPLSLVWAGVVVNLAASLAGAAVVARLAQRLLGPRAAFRTAALLGFFPGAFVFNMVYSEGLLLLLAAACLLALIDRRWVLAGTMGMLAGLTRPNSVALVVAGAVAAMVAIRRRREWAALSAPLLTAGGTAAVFVFLAIRTGEPLAYFRSKADGWPGNGIGYDLSTLGAHLRSLVEDPLLDLNLLTSLPTLLLAGAGCWLLWRRRHDLPPEVTAYAFAAVAMAAVTNTYGSAARQVMMAFPLLFPLADWREDGYATALALSASTMVAFFVLSRVGLYTP